MVSTVSDLFAAGLAESTHTSYDSGCKRYVEFCRGVERDPFPVSEDSLCLFVAKMFLDGLGAGTVKSYLAAVRHRSIAEGMGDPNRKTMHRLEYVVKGVKKKLAGKNSRMRRPIRVEELKALKHVWEKSPNRWDATMLWAAAVMCFFGFLRSGEVVAPTESSFDRATNLTFGDVRVDSLQNPQYVEVKLKASKTDVFRKGVTVFLGRTGGGICPVAAVLSYMVVRDSSDGPFFKYSDGRYLTRTRFVEEMRQGLAQAGLQAGEYAGHSFRIGAATSAAERGLLD